MSGQLHILNGDGFVHALSSLGMDKEPFVVWREALALGQVSPQIGSMEFIKNRRSYLTPEYSPVNAESYESKFLPELKAIDLDKSDEIVCWFGPEYFCQVNLCGLIYYLTRQLEKDATISLIPGEESLPERRVRCIGDLDESELRNAYQKRKPLSSEAIGEACFFWNHFAQGEPEILFNFYQKNYNRFHFTYLQATLSRYFRLFPSLDKGLNAYESYILQQGKKLGEGELKTLVRTCLGEDFNYGLGDIALLASIRDLSQFLHLKPNSLLDDHFSCTEIPAFGSRSQADEFIQNKAQWLGGAKAANFRWYSQKNELKFTKA